MKFTVNGNGLAKVLGLTLGVMEKKSTIPVLSNLLIEPDTASSIRVIGTDLDITSISKIEVAQMAGKGAICVQGRKLHDILKTLPTNSNFELEETDNHWVKLKAGKFNSRLAGVSSECFPEIPRCFGGTEVTLSVSVLMSLIELTQFAITMEQSRFTLSGAKLMIERNIARMVATDGHRLALAEVTLTEPAANKFEELIPKKALTELSRICRENEGDAPVVIKNDQNHLFFSVGGTEIIARKLSGNFPNYEMVLPQGNDKSFVIGANTLREVMQRVRQMADERTSSVKFSVRPGELVMEARSSEEGEAQEVTEIAYDGEAVEFGINSNYGLDALGQILSFMSGQENKNVVVSFKDANTQLLITLEDETRSSLRYVVMPLRI